MNLQDFYVGKAFDAYTYFGAHYQIDGVMFRTYGPQADRICLIGDFNNWKEVDMVQSGQSGIWELKVGNVVPGQMYKYVVYGHNGRVEHCDPYGFGMELRPNFASIIRKMNDYGFMDEKWMKSRNLCYGDPLNIYELHLGSWRHNENNENGWYRYDEIADDLIWYLKENHYTHVEFMPLSEHPFDGSWGYQNTGFFAPTSRYGTARELKILIDRLHQAGVGAIIDFVPAHFATDYYGLRLFDGDELYEYPASDIGNSEWGSCNFLYSRGEIRSFLQSAANYWLTEYHFDGLRMDAVSRLIYWQGQESRGENKIAIDFIKTMNSGIRALHPSAMLIAEDSTSYPNVTRPVEDGGLGFDYKWDLGWMNDTLDYFMKQSDERKDLPGKLTFSMFYFYNERYLLPLSHDEVVHGKKTIVDKIFGSYEEKFAQARCLYMYMMMHPGKKLNFMGNEIGMFREWDEKKEPDWFILKYPMHDSFHKYIIELNKIYQSTLALYAWDYDPKGFEWLTINENGSNVFGIKRTADDCKVAALFNFSDKEVIYQAVEDWRIELNSDWDIYSGSTPKTNRNRKTGTFKLAPFSCLYLTK